MAGQNQADLFDTYFRRADLDHDGRISGAEAVAFFQGSNLSKPVLAQIWNHADQNRTGFLGRAEFYNALKLVTVAQSKRELTQDIVKAALFGPAAAKIPAPQINLQAIPGPGAAAPSPHMGVAAPTGPQNLGFRGPQAPPNAGMSQQYLPPQGNQFMRPPQMPAGAGSVPPQGVPGQGFPRGSTVGGGSTMGVGSTMGPRPPTSNVSTDWLGARPAGAPVGTTSQAPSRGVTPSAPLDTFGQFGLTSSLQPRSLATSAVAPSVALKSQDQPQLSFQPAAKDSKSLVVAGNGFASDSVFGGDVFSATSSQTKSLAAPTYSASSLPASSAIVPVTSGPQTSVKQSPLDSLQSTFTMQPGGGQLQRTQSLVKQNQQTPTPSTSGFVSSGMPSGAANPASSQSQLSWPRMTQSDVQKYTKVFVEVDTDRDGKITGEQARNLFLHWKLPREVLKHVWDLSDQDNDSMLSLREFCTALYLMERYREGRPLPPVLPNNIMFDETLMTTGGQQTAAYGNAAWRPSSGMQPQHGLPGAQPITPRGGGRPQMQVPYHPQADGVQPDQKKSKVPVLEKHLVNQLSTEEQNSLNSKFKEASDADKKVEELEKEILDSREKIEYYRTKMQELVLYKSRCDNRLNEIMERAIADKKEVESLSKKYEEKYKQVGDVASKLTIEEATFREIHERKMELYNAIVKIEQGGSADGILQVRADRIQSDLEELVKALNERCKKYGLKVKPTALVELPFGWQPGIQEGAADWDEDWDKFEDEGFSFVKELTVDVQNVIAPPKEKSKPVRKEKPSIDEGSAVSSPNANGKTEVPSGTSEHAHEGGSTYAHSEDESARSLPGSPEGRNSLESPSREFRDNHFGKNSEADSPFHSKENHSDHGGAESSFSGDKGFDEPSWGTFDTNDDTDSVWGNPINTREMDHERHGENSFFGSGSDFGLNRIRTDSPQGDSFFGRNTFADSVPGTPLFNSGLSPPRFSEASEDHSFDVLNFGSRYDSFSMSRNDSRRENLARFDSIRSTNDSEYGRGGVFASFDESDPFGSSGPFRPSETPKTPKKASDSWSAF